MWVPRPPCSHPPSGTAALWSLQVLGRARAPRKVGEDVSPSTRGPPSSLLPPLFPQAKLGGFYHIKMCGPMGLTRLREGRKSHCSPGCSRER